MSKQQDDQNKPEGHVVKCGTCKGTGKSLPYVKCDVCKGVGSILLK